ncbi:hypothetical protein EDD37DRAFT_628067 [Exophiala viscosa]|uniref:uncharacterized protein n=1 Tax=Exophiala viscosa TaxID=2486360 RepID=UPI0021A1BFC1|nr:hypothetical protein EDD37DRAFT_628067 [Exophiala viscosa]
MEGLAIPKSNKRKRRVLSCLPCREHKLKCDHKAPCSACTRYDREARCCQYPSSLIKSASQSHGILCSKSRESGVSSLDPEATIQRARSSLPTDFPQWGSWDFPFDSVDTISLRQKTVASVVTGRIPIVATTDDKRDYWRLRLAENLPEQQLCNILVDYFFVNLNWIYHATHVPSFREEYSAFWSQRTCDIDLHWLALLFSLVCSAAIVLPTDLCEQIGVNREDVRRGAHAWYSASRQALAAHNWEAHPSFLALQTVINLQHYLYATKKTEIVYS